MSHEEGCRPDLQCDISNWFWPLLWREKILSSTKSYIRHPPNVFIDIYLRNVCSNGMFKSQLKNSSKLKKFSLFKPQTSFTHHLRNWTGDREELILLWHSWKMFFSSWYLTQKSVSSCASVGLMTTRQAVVIRKSSVLPQSRKAATSGKGLTHRHTTQHKTYSW